MSRLNASIKLLYLLGEAFFILLSIIVTLISSLVLSGRWEAFHYDSARNRALLVLVGASITLLCSICCGCCGSIHQIKRKGFCAGRRILGLHQIILVSLFVLCARHTIGVGRRDASLAVVLADPMSYPQYDLFEKQLSQYFNDAYFDGICSVDIGNDSSEAWLMRWIDQNCPLILGDEGDICAPNRSDLLPCDTECEDSAATGQECCPSEVLCRTGVQDACPYQQCRVNVLSEVSTWLQRLLAALRVVAVLSMMMVVLTCLLICYNPRDQIETELYKSGAFSKQDVETIQRLKAEKMFTFDTNNKKNSQSINLDMLHERVIEIKRGRAAQMGANARAKGRKHSKVSPSPSPVSTSDDDIERR